MATQDEIEFALGSPVDWGKFEKLAYEILVNDDLPSLRLLGGGNDHGVDAIEESFYRNEQQTDIVVQITSERAQQSKFVGTVKKLKTNNIDFSELIIVYRHPVSSEIRRNIQASAKKQSVSVDIRDQSYLVTQLGKTGNSIFPRFFGTARDQYSILLANPDPLNATSSQSQLAMLAILGTFVLSEKAQISRKTLFRNTVLAAIAASQKGLPLGGVLSVAQELLPEEVLNPEQINSAISDLQKEGRCEIENGIVQATNSVLLATGKVLSNTKAAFDELLKAILRECRKEFKIDNAAGGYIERNLRRALLALFRSYGPVNDVSNPIPIPRGARDDIAAIVSRDLEPDISRKILIELSGYIEQSENWTSLAPLVRSYSALAIRNLDPMGRRWQKAAMSRSSLALDTDALLYILVQDLPESSAFHRAVQSLQKSGVKIVVPTQALAEVSDHIEGSDRTHFRFQNSLSRMSSAMVDGNVWNAVVRGFYYAQASGFSGDWANYKSRYYDDRSPLEYLRIQLSRRIEFEEAELQEIPTAWETDLESIASYLLERKEHARLKAGFRDPGKMEQRLKADIRMAMHLSVSDPSLRPIAPRGYLASEDKAFTMIQSHSNWGSRERVHVFTHVVPELSEFASDARLSDSEVIKLLFHPIIVASAQLHETEIRALASAGVDLRNVYLPRLDWDLSRGLRDRITSASKASFSSDQDEIANSTLDMVSAAKDLGYALDPRVERWIATASPDADNLREENERLKSTLVHVAIAAAGQSEKGKRRARAALREVGLDISDISPSNEGT